MRLSKTKFSPLDFLELAGFDRNELLARMTLDKSLAPEEVELQSKLIVNLLPAAVQLSKNPSLALNLGQLNYVSQLGIFGFAVQSCSNLRQILTLMLRYHPIMKQEVRWQIGEFENNVSVRFKMDTGSTEQQKLMTELAFSNFFAVAKTLTNKSLAATEVHLIFPKPDYYRTYKKFLPVPLRFNQPHNQILVPKAVLDSPVKTANPASQVVFQQLCEEMLQDLNRIENTSAAVRRLLIQSAGDFPNIDQVADKLHMSKSTLGRRLERECTSFRTIIDEVKNLLAKEYLTNTELTVADIAHLLDYTDTANFRRAFVRWNKMTPSAFRQVL